MAEIPLPSLETLSKISGWFGEQAKTWLAIVRNPVVFLSELDLASQDVLASSLKFFFCVLLATHIIHIPLFSILYHLDAFDAATAISLFFVFALQVVLFGYCIYAFGRLLRGNGTLMATFISTFYISAFLPIMILASVPAAVQEVVYRNAFHVDPLFDNNGYLKPSPTYLLLLAVWLAAQIYVVIKIVPVVKYVHKFDTFRALAVLGGACLVYFAYLWLVFWPLGHAMLQNSQSVSHSG